LFLIGTGTGTGMGQEPVPNPPLFNASSNASITFDFIISPINFTGCGRAMARPYKHPHNAQMLSVLPIKGTPPPRIMFTIFKERALKERALTLLSCSEVALRNAIDWELTAVFPISPIKSRP